MPSGRQRWLAAPRKRDVPYKPRGRQHYFNYTAMQLKVRRELRVEAVALL